MSGRPNGKEAPISDGACDFGWGPRLRQRRGESSHGRSAR